MSRGRSASLSGRSLLPACALAACAFAVSDEARFWSEVDHLHPALGVEGYSWFDADEASAAAFGLGFGVAVEGHGRIAHDLFALVDGVFVGAEIPFQPLAVPDVDGFLDRVERLLLRRPAMTAPEERRS
ncbi:MAG TPA: hypothetical protein VHH90_08770 [Polyangia bacterium]|nr:hypothetical protein [Polyangia bacterium]